MRISEITLFHVAIPCVPFETSFGTISLRPALIIEIRSETGITGYGEASLLYEPVSEKEVLADGLALLETKLPMLVGNDVAETPGLLAAFPKNFPITSLAVESAYLDILAKERSVPLATYFGAQKATVRAGESIGLQGGIDGMLRDIGRYVTQGIGRIKIKIKPGSDVELLRAARAAYPGLELGADANAAYVKNDLPLLESLRQFDLAFIEQPFAAADLESHRVLNTAGIPVCLDESIVSEESCRKAIAYNACSLVNIKPARIGSFSRAKRIHDMCHSKGIGLFGGGRLETGVGKTINASFYALPGFTHASDITPPAEYLQSDIISPTFELHQGAYTILEAPGSGIALQPDVIKEFMVGSKSFT